MSEDSRAGVWRLTIEKENGSCISVCGAEPVLREELDAWVKYESKTAEEWKAHEERGEEYREIEGSKPRIIYGWAADVTRSECVIAYRLTDVVGMALVQL